MSSTRNILVAAASVLTFSTAHAAPPPPIPVTACGQVVPARARAVLATDLDCSGVQEGVVLESGAKLALDGHALVAGASVGVLCRRGCAVSGPGTITGGGGGISSNGSLKVAGVEIVGTINGITTDGLRSVTVTGSVFRDNFKGITQAKGAKVDGSTFTDNSVAIEVDRASVSATTITGGSFGISSRAATVKKGSSIDTSGGGGAARDFNTGSRPQLKNSTCAGHSFNWNTGGSWGLCALD